MQRPVNVGAGVDVKVRAAFETALRKVLQQRNLVPRFQKTAVQMNALLSHVPNLPPFVRI